MLAAFRRIELRESRALDARLPVFAASGDLLLFNAVFKFPNFGAVIFREAQDDHFKDGVIGLDINLVMKLGDEGAEGFKEGDTDGFEVGRGLVRKALIMLVGAGHTLKIAIEAYGLGIGRDLPLGSAEDDAHVSGVKLQEARGDGIGFQGLVDRGEDDDIFLSDLDNDAAAGEVGDDFVFALWGLGDGCCG